MNHSSVSLIVIGSGFRRLFLPPIFYSPVIFLFSLIPALIRSALRSFSNWANEPSIPNTPKTNGMVERVNRTIKENTIYATKYKSLNEMKESLLVFMKQYNINRLHTSLKKEIKVRTPMDAYRYWYDKHTDLFHKTPDQFLESLLSITWWNFTNNVPKQVTGKSNIVIPNTIDAPFMKAYFFFTKQNIIVGIK